MFELDAGGVGCEVPVCLGISAVAMLDPGCDLLGEGLLVGDAPIEALRGQDGQLGFGEIEPGAMLGRVMPFEPFDQATGFGSGEGLIERCLRVDVEIVLDQNNGLGVGKWVSDRSFRTWA